MQRPGRGRCAAASSANRPSRAAGAQAGAAPRAAGDVGLSGPVSASISSRFFFRRCGSRPARPQRRWSDGDTQPCARNKAAGPLAAARGMRWSVRIVSVPDEQVMA